MPTAKKSKSKGEIADAIRQETDVSSKTFEELEAFNAETISQLAEVEKNLVTLRSDFGTKDNTRKELCVSYRKNPVESSSAAWHHAVSEASTANDALRAAREHRFRLEALAALLAEEIRKRRRENPELVAEPKRKRQKGAPAEPCPFCGHCYTVRDGLSSKVDAQGNRLQLRKCQCREKAPPCKNCPTCRLDVGCMAVEGAAQAEICKTELQCAICACACPGVGKWIEGNEESRAKFRQKTEARHVKLSELLQASWSGDPPAPPTAPEPLLSSCLDVSALDGAISAPAAAGLRRLPADIKGQLEAVAAAHSLLAVTALHGSDATVAAGGAVCRATTEANKNGNGGVNGHRRNREGLDGPEQQQQRQQRQQEVEEEEEDLSPGRLLNTVEESDGEAAEEDLHNHTINHHHNHHGHGLGVQCGRHKPGECPAECLGDSHEPQEPGQSQRRQEERNHHHHHHHHHHHGDGGEEGHVHRGHVCDHPHDECTSECCSVA